MICMKSTKLKSGGAALKLSMWILADWLKKYNPQIKIKDGREELDRLIADYAEFSEAVKIILNYAGDKKMLQKDIV